MTRSNLPPPSTGFSFSSQMASPVVRQFGQTKLAVNISCFAILYFLRSMTGQRALGSADRLPGPSRNASLVLPILVAQRRFYSTLFRGNEDRDHRENHDCSDRN